MPTRRISQRTSDFAPYCTHPDLPQLHNQIAECRTGLAELGKKARERGIRLSLHPWRYVRLSALDPAINDRGIRDASSQAELLDAMEQGPEAVVIVHLGGAHGDKEAAIARFRENFPRLQLPVQTLVWRPAIDPSGAQAMGRNGFCTCALRMTTWSAV